MRVGAAYLGGIDPRAMDPQEIGKDVVDRILADSATPPSQYEIAGRRLSPGDVVRHLGPLLTGDRRDRIDEVLDGRTYAVATVVEGLVNSGNVSAVMRTAEGFGFQRFDLVTGSAPYKHSKRTTQGAQKWLDVRVWEGPAACASALKQAGYRVVATHLDGDARPIDAFDFTEPTALVFGNELNGVSDEMLALADAGCVVPMAGFVRSFNISVAAAVALYHARQDRVRRLGRSGDLTDSEAERLRAAFYFRSVRNAEAILERSLDRHD